MRRKLFFIALTICMSCTENNDYIITTKGVGAYILGKKLETTYDKETLNIKVSKEDSIITDIVVKSTVYKTQEGYGIGTELKKIEPQKGAIKKDLDLKKEKIRVGSMGDSVFYNDMWFIDMDKNGIIDLIWLSHNK